ncbi:MAG: DUF4399 domain-containing protein [Polaromonas sp.]|nr:DUF4399 domain-containing protein [Polaromonas sp.]
MTIKKISAAVFAVVVPFLCFAQIKPAVPAASGVQAPVLHPWQAPPRQGTADAYFVNLEDGASIETPFRLAFGLAGGWGLAPISSPSPGKSGHHHLLVNRDLPLDFKQALPFSDQYIHFGKGQMETVLTLEPGTYSLRLLLANDKHVPHFVYSKPIKITVTRKNKDIDAKSLIKKGISLQNVIADAKLSSPFKIGFHASGLNVAHLGQAEKDTGHFRLTIIPQGGGKPAELDFVNGQTETWLSPPPGTYALKLDFVDNANPGKTLVEPITLPVRVQ